MKLLNKSIRSYIAYASVVLLIAIPVLYAAIQQIVAEDVDENLLVQKERIISRLQKVTDPGNLTSMGMLDSSITFRPSQPPITMVDSLYTSFIFDTIANEKIPYRILMANISLHGKSYCLQIKNSLIDSEDLIESIVIIVAFLLFLIIAGLVLINRLLSKKLWKPFYNSIDKLHRFKIEKDELLQFEKNGITEFTVLNNAITELTNRSRQVYLSQKEFTENASHEMQTPLAVMQGKIDLLMQTDPLSKEQSELISGLADVSQRMSHLNKSLLLLTKIENNQFPKTENVQLKQVVEKLVEQYSSLAASKGIVIQNIYTLDIAVTANSTLIEIMIGNLLSNAIRHNMFHGSVIITGNHKEIIFQNTGVPGSLDAGKLFKRFQKVSSDNSSVGLGLEIARQIAEQYGFSISYQLKGPLHTFIISFAR